MAVSTIPTLKGALVDRLTADANLGGAAVPVQIAYGLPAVTLDREYVIVGNTRPEDGTDSSLFPGGQSSSGMRGTTYLREERYVLEVISGVRMNRRESQRTVTERAFAIAGFVENSLRSWMADSSFVTATGGARWALLSSLTHQEYIGTEDREARLFIDIAVSARI